MTGMAEETDSSISFLPGIRPVLEPPASLEMLSIGLGQAKWEVCSKQFQVKQQLVADRV